MRSEIVPFLGAMALITVTPGPDTAVVVRSALRDGSGAALRTAAGTCLGLLGWGALAALGVAAVLAASAAAFTAVKLLGAAYLLWLGIRALVTAGSAPPDDGAPVTAQARGAFAVGLFTNLLNPKAALFFTALLPQFVSPQDPVLAVSALMTVIASAASLAWLSLYALLIPRVGDVLRQPAVRRRIDRCTGVVLIVLGLRIAVERR